MPLWGCFFSVIIAGATGGLVNAFLSNNGFVVPTKIIAGTSTIWRPGVLGNVFVGSVASTAAWAMYGPVANTTIRSFSQAEDFRPFVIGLSLIIGIGGARWLSNEVDKRLLRTVGQRLARDVDDPEIARVAATALENDSPAECLEKLLRLGA
jgi:hypothetical protein